MPRPFDIEDIIGAGCLGAPVLVAVTGVNWQRKRCGGRLMVIAAENEVRSAGRRRVTAQDAGWQVAGRR